MSDDDGERLDDTFNEPRLAINRVYTRRGDAGETSLVGGERLGKDALRIEAYGTVDELGAFVGAALVLAREANAEWAGERANAEAGAGLGELATILRRVQHELFNLGAILATRPDQVHPSQPRIRAGEIEALEREVDQMNEQLPALRSFVLPGGSRLSVTLHQCRTIARRAERVCVALSRQEDVEAECLSYLNRLGDALFVWSRWADLVQAVEEVLWDPNQASSAD